MRSLVSWCGLVAAAAALGASGLEPDLSAGRYLIAGDEPGGWPSLLGAAGFVPGPGGLTVLTAHSADQASVWKERIEGGERVVLTGESPLAAALGIRPRPGKPILVRGVTDEHNPKLEIVWETSVAAPWFELPEGARVFTRERWTGAPLAAGLQVGRGAVVWLAVPPGRRGYERFPYLVQALAEIGARAPWSSRRLWAFFDASWRSRVDLNYFANRWQASGLAALHVAAWHFWEPDPERDAYLERLIEACHRRAILVYAWIEFPHVSEAFWRENPAWREKTGSGQDAHLDWRKLMNLQNRECARAVSAGLTRLVERFDWDGLNIAELYFESLEGIGNAARFTPMNDDVRREFARAGGFDPQELVRPDSPRHHSKDPQSLRLFLNWRVDLAARMQQEWIGEAGKLRARHPRLDLVLTHVDDRYDSRMRDLIGADAARLVPLAETHDFTFLIEDPATVWHLGPERYPEIARRYQPLTTLPERLAIDINIVERYQDVYPTKQQTGVELYQLVSLAAQAFSRVALYFESSLLKVDLPHLAAAAAAPRRIEQVDGKWVVESPRGIGIPWQGPARVDGQIWPWFDGRLLWLPPGAHAIEPGGAPPPARILAFTGELTALNASPDSIEFSYRAPGRAWLIVDRPPAAVMIDGLRTEEPYLKAEAGARLGLPRGQHLVELRFPAAGARDSAQPTPTGGTGDGR